VPFSHYGGLIAAGFETLGESRYIDIHGRTKFREANSLRVGARKQAGAGLAAA
jgi:hypothetical protein